MNPIPLPPNSHATDRPRARGPMPPPAFHSLRAFIPRKTIRRMPALALPKPPSYETRAIPIELTYMS